MRVIPVIDLKQGEVVRGIAGQREAYRAVRSRLAADASPDAIAAAFARLGLQRTYVADLDAIQGAAPDWEALERIARHQPQIWLDAGVTDLGRTAALLDFRQRCRALSGVIIGLESVPDPPTLQNLFTAAGPELAVFSLDMLHARILTDSADWHGLTPLEIAEVAVETGFRRLIVLDLASVGTGKGIGAEALCREIRRRCPRVELVTGGGIRNLKDLQRLASLGCQGALVASALHDGRLTAEDLASVPGLSDL